MNRFTCPCCGYMTLSDWPGSYSICSLCFWEDDAVQLLDPWYEGGANRPSLVESQATYASCGAMEDRFLTYVRGVSPADLKDPQWRPVAEHDRPFVRIPRDLTDAEFRDLDVLYYWRRPVN